MMVSNAAWLFNLLTGEENSGIIIKKNRKEAYL